MKRTPRQAQTWRWVTERDEVGVELDLEGGVLRWFAAPRVLADAPMSAQDGAGWEQPLEEWLGGAPSPVDCPAHVAEALRAAGPREQRRRAHRTPKPAPTASSPAPTTAAPASPSATEPAWLARLRVEVARLTRHELPAFARLEQLSHQEWPDDRPDQAVEEETTWRVTLADGRALTWVSAKHRDFFEEWRGELVPGAGPVVVRVEFQHVLVTGWPELEAALNAP